MKHEKSSCLPLHRDDPTVQVYQSSQNHPVNMIITNLNQLEKIPCFVPKLKVYAIL